MANSELCIADVEIRLNDILSGIDNTVWLAHSQRFLPSALRFTLNEEKMVAEGAELIKLPI